MLRIGRPTPAQVRDLIEQSACAELTYEAVGATGSERPLATGLHRDQAVFVVNGSGGFDRAKEGLATWRAHRGAGADVSPLVLGPGETVVVTFRAGPVRLVAPCRIVYVLDEPDRFGFAYGTLPGHPERGEEAFVLERQDDTTTLLSITAFSAPAAWYVRVAGPFARLVQRRVTRRYGRALQEWVQDQAA